MTDKLAQILASTLKQEFDRGYIEAFENRRKSGGSRWFGRRRDDIWPRLRTWWIIRRTRRSVTEA